MSSSCDLYLFQGKITNQDMMNRLVKVAESQKNQYLHIFPWNIRMASNTIMIVAASDVMCLRGRQANPAIVPTPRTNICGWLTAYLYKKKNHNFMYLSELSSKSALDKDNGLYKGLARRMFDKLVDYAKNNNVGFIYLYPMNDAVRDIYTRWGFSEAGQNRRKYQYYRMDINDGIFNNAVQSLESKENDVIVDDFDAIAENLTREQSNFMRSIEETDEDLYNELFATISLMSEELNSAALNNEISNYLCSHGFQVIK